MKKMNLKIILIFFLTTNLLISSEINKDINDEFNFINKSLNRIKEAEQKFNIKRESFNKEVFLQLELIDKEKKKLEEKEQKINNKIKELKEKEQKMQKLAENIKKSLENKLVNIYNKMSARSAAKILEKLWENSPINTLKIFIELNEKQAKSILSKMKKGIAAEITNELSNKEFK